MNKRNWKTLAAKRDEVLKDFIERFGKNTDGWETSIDLDSIDLQTPIDRVFVTKSVIEQNTGEVLGDITISPVENKDGTIQFNGVYDSQNLAPSYHNHDISDLEEFNEWSKFIEDKALTDSGHEPVWGFGDKFNLIGSKAHEGEEPAHESINSELNPPQITSSDALFEALDADEAPSFDSPKSTASETTLADVLTARKAKALSELEAKYIIAGSEFHRKDVSNPKDSLLFKGSDKNLITKHDDVDTVRAMILATESKGWHTIQVKGTEDFRRLAWIEAAARGIEVTGYKPSEIDIQKSNELKASLEKNQVLDAGVNAISKDADAKKEIAPKPLDTDIALVADRNVSDFLVSQLQAQKSEKPPRTDSEVQSYSESKEFSDLHDHASQVFKNLGLSPKPLREHLLGLYKNNVEIQPNAPIERDIAPSEPVNEITRVVPQRAIEAPARSR
jgi:hypothetical protein